MEDHVRETLARLLTDQGQTLKRLVEAAERLIRIDRTSGGMVLVVPRLYISDRDLIGLLLLSRYFAHKLGLASKETLTMAEIVQESGLDERAVSSRLTELGFRGIIDNISGGEFSISFQQVEYFLEEAKHNMLIERNKTELLAANANHRFDSEYLHRSAIAGQEELSGLANIEKNAEKKRRLLESASMVLSTRRIV